MSEQELKNALEGTSEQVKDESKKTNTAKTVWLIVMIASFALSILCFVMGIIGIFVSLGLLMLPIVGIFGIIFTILCFVGAVLFLGLGIGSIFGVVRSGKTDTNSAE